MVGESILLYLDSEGLGDKTSDLRLGSQPDSPANCTTIYEETAPVLNESQGFQVDTVGIQILVRNTDYKQARDKCQAIHKKISMFRGQFDDSGPVVRQTEIATPPSSIGKDSDDRHEWTAHYIAEYESTGNDNRTTK